MKSVFSLPRLRAALVGLDTETEVRKLDAQIRNFIAAHTPTQEHFAKRVTIFDPASIKEALDDLRS